MIITKEYEICEKITEQQQQIFFWYANKKIK